MTIELNLTLADQRKIVEHIFGGPAFRIYITANEKRRLDAAGVVQEQTAHPLKDGRWALWRKESDIQKLMDHGEITMAGEINSRRLGDDEV